MDQSKTRWCASILKEALYGKPESPNVNCEAETLKEAVAERSSGRK
jgi:hypothetical protein